LHFEREKGQKDSEPGNDPRGTVKKKKKERAVFSRTKPLPRGKKLSGQPGEGRPGSLAMESGKGHYGLWRIRKGEFFHVPLRFRL